MFNNNFDGFGSNGFNGNEFGFNNGFRGCPCHVHGCRHHHRPDRDLIDRGVFNLEMGIVEVKSGLMGLNELPRCPFDNSNNNNHHRHHCCFSQHCCGPF